MINNHNKLEMMKSGIYLIINLKNNKQYIGSATNFQKRSNFHSCRLKNNKHENKYLQNSFNKYGLNYFEFKIIEICDKEICKEIEQKYLDIIFDSDLRIEKYYNISNKASGPPIRFGIEHHNYGKKLSDETKQKIRKSIRGENHPNYGKNFSIETIEKLRKINIGKIILIMAKTIYRN